jgi:hypothetical protein
VAEDGKVDAGGHGHIILDVTSPLEVEDCDLSELAFLAIREQNTRARYTLYGLALRRDRERDVFLWVGWAELSCKPAAEKAWKATKLKIRENTSITIA